MDDKDEVSVMDIPETRWDRLPEDIKLETTKQLFSADVPWGLYNVVPESFRNALTLINPRWMSQKEETATKNADPGEMDENFRLSFWTEYNSSKDLGKPFSLKKAMAGVCSPFYYKTVILKKPRLLAYIVYPPTNYMNFMQNMLYKGQQRMKEIMSASAVKTIDDGKGKVRTEVDMKLASLQLKTFALIDNRVKGAIVQRVKVEQKNLNVNLSAEQVASATPETLIDIDRQLNQIDREMSRNDEIMKNRRALEGHTQPLAPRAVPVQVIPKGDDTGKKH